MDFHHVPSCGGYAMLIDAVTRLYAFEWLDIWRRNRFRSTAQPIMAISPSLSFMVLHTICAIKTWVNCPYVILDDGHPGFHQPIWCGDFPIETSSHR